MMCAGPPKWTYTSLLNTKKTVGSNFFIVPTPRTFCSYNLVHQIHPSILRVSSVRCYVSFPEDLENGCYKTAPKPPCCWDRGKISLFFSVGLKSLQTEIYFFFSRCIITSTSNIATDKFS